MEIYFYQAECGDAARLHYKSEDGKNRNIIIDSGYGKTFRHILADVILSIMEVAENIDLWVISHIHDDHIGGVIKYIVSIHTEEYQDVVSRWYYNSPRFYSIGVSTNSNSISSAKSIDNGDILYGYLSDNEKLLPYDITNELEVQNLFGLKIHILSPTREKLKKLREKYSIEEDMPLEKNETESISDAVGAKQHDYDIKLEDFNLNHWEEDRSPENGSSISLLTEYEGKRILWLADSHPSDIVASLKMKGYSSTNKLKCDWVKVAHHGSKGNNSNELYDLIECTNYLLSANGINRDYLPTKESIARILRSSTRKEGLHYTFYFTYDNSVLRRIFDVDGEDVYQKMNFSVEYLNDNKFIYQKL